MFITAVCVILLIKLRLPKNKSFKNVTSYINRYNTAYFKSRVLSVFPSSSDASNHFHIETPSFISNQLHFTVGLACG